MAKEEDFEFGKHKEVDLDFKPDVEKLEKLGGKAINLLGQLKFRAEHRKERHLQNQVDALKSKIDEINKMKQLKKEQVSLQKQLKKLSGVV
jgi:hypothetical protein